MSLILTGVIDGPLSGGVPKAVELYATADIADLSIYGIESANNGAAASGQEFTFPAEMASAGDYIYVASEAEGFNEFFGFEPHFTSSALAINGDDALVLYENGTAIDAFGEVGVDGTGETWEHLDGWAYRNDATGPSTSFSASDWSFSGPNALDGATTNATAGSMFPAGSYSVGPTLVAGTDFDGEDVNLIAGFDPATENLDGGPGDFFGVGSFGAWPQDAGVPFGLIDVSVAGLIGAPAAFDPDAAFIGDDEGVFGQNSDVDNDFFGVSDTREFVPAVASWTFDISGAENLQLVIDMGGIADGEEFGGYSDSTSAVFTYAIDGGASIPAFLISAETVTGDFAYRAMDDGTVTPDDAVLEVTGPETVTKLLAEDGSEAADQFLDKSPASGDGAGQLDSFATSLAGAGDTLTLTFSADVPFEAMAFDNIRILGQPGVSAGVTIVESDGATQVTEGAPFGADGLSDSYTLVLDTQPTSDVTVNLATDQVAGSPPSLTFTPENWFEPQTVTVTASDDAVAEGPHQGGVFHSVVSDDAAYDGLSVPSVSVSITDNDFEITLISQIQGSSDFSALDGFAQVGVDDRSPLEDQLVTIEAVVSADFQNGDAGPEGSDLNGFFVLEELGDQDGSLFTSEGIFINEGDADGDLLLDVAVGDIVRITGVVEENFGNTQIDAEAITIVGNDPNLLSVSEVAFSDLGVLLDDDDEYVVDLEAYEGMLIEVTTTMTVTEMFNLDRFGEYRVSDGRPAQFTQNNAPDEDGFDAHLQDVAARSLVLDDGQTFQNPDQLEIIDGGNGVLDANDSFRMGDQIKELTGVVNYAFDEFRLQDPTGAYVEANPRPETPADVGGDFKVASFNVLNFFTTIDDGTTPIANGLDPRGADDLTGDSDSVPPASEDPLAEFNRQLEKLVDAILAIDADVLGLVELENDFFQEGDAGVDVGGNAIEFLTSAVNGALGAEVYDWIDPTPTQDRFVGTDAISTGLIYKQDALTPVGDAAVLVFEEASAATTFATATALNEFVSSDDQVGDFARNRPAVAATFEDETGERVTVAVNHFKSKGDSNLEDTFLDASGRADQELIDALLADPNYDQNDGAGFWNQVRADAAGELAAWLATDPTGAGAEKVLIVGDLNAYAQEEPVQILTDAGYVDIARDQLGEAAYSFVFDGQIGTLDYALANQPLFETLTGVTEWHINADEADAIDYNLNFGRDASLFNGDTPARNSDHDPVIVGFDLQADPEPDLFVGLFDADDDQLIVELIDGATIDAALLEGRDVTIAATVRPDGAFGGMVESVRLDLNDGQAERLENVEPYALFGDRTGGGSTDYRGRTDFLGVGENEIDFTLFSENRGRGEEIATVSRSFTIFEEPVDPLESLFVGLYDADSDELITRIENGAAIDTASAAFEGVSLGDLTIGVEIVEGGVFDDAESVRLTLNDGEAVRIESVEPYALFGDRAGDFRKGTGLELEQNKLVLEIFDEDRARGEELDEVVIEFTLEGDMIA